MKKAMVFALTALLALSFIGCGKKEAADDVSTSDTQLEQTTDTTDPTTESDVTEGDVTEEASVTEDASATEEAEVTEDSSLTGDEEVVNDTATEETVEDTTDAAEVIDYENAKLIALTFDDGPNTQITPQVLDILEEHDVVATFFLIGQNINDSSIPVMKRQVELGCEIASHSYTHSNMTTFTPEEMQEEMKKTSDKIFDAVGVTPKFFRPPYISVNSAMHQAIDLPFICGIMANDWDATATAEDRANGIINNTRDGNIILLHDFPGNTQTVEALKTIIPALKEKGFVFVTVSDLFKYKNVDPNKEYQVWTMVE